MSATAETHLGPIIQTVLLHRTGNESQPQGRRFPSCLGRGWTPSPLKHKDSLSCGQFPETLQLENEPGLNHSHHAPRRSAPKPHPRIQPTESNLSYTVSGSLKTTHIANCTNEHKAPITGAKLMMFPGTEMVTSGPVAPPQNRAGCAYRAGRLAWPASRTPSRSL